MVRAKTAGIILALGLILLLGNKLRAFSYASVPHPGETADEYSFGWLGLSLIQERYPIAWSGIGAYEIHDFQKINVDGIYNADPNRPAFSIDKPWFDHPPLFGLVTGGYAYWKGVRGFESASVGILRRPMLKIAWLTTVLIFILGRRLYGNGVGLLAVLLYSVVPTTVISSRLALAENGYVPIFLGAIILADYYLEEKKMGYWVGASFLAGVGVLFKLSAMAIGLALILMVVGSEMKKKGKMVGVVLGGVFFGGLAFVIYGAHYDWGLFWRVMAANSGRFYGASAEVVYSLVTKSKMTAEKFLTDGWIVAGWMAMVLLAAREWKRTRGGMILPIAMFSYLIVLVIFGSESYGWYRFPFYPFLMIALAREIVEQFEKPNWLVFSVLMFLPFGTSVHRLVGVEGFQGWVSFLRVGMVVLLGLFGLSLVKKRRLIKLERTVMIVILVFLIWLSVKEVYYFSYETWFFVT